MPQEELDLFDLAACGVAQLCTGPAEIMSSEVILRFTDDSEKSYMGQGRK